MRIAASEGCAAVHMERQGSLEATILLVDDAERWRDQVCRILGTRPEWKVVAEACDGYGAVQKALEVQPDIVVLDIGLPDLNGIEVAKEVRQRCPLTAIVFLTQETDSDIMREALSVGQASYVIKANASRDLLDAIATALSRS